VTSVVVADIAAAQAPATGFSFDATLTLAPSIFSSGNAQ
jgi:hypothetical protein